MIKQTQFSLLTELKNQKISSIDPERKQIVGQTTIRIESVLMGLKKFFLRDYT